MAAYRREVDLDAVDHRIGTGLHSLLDADLAQLLTIDGGREGPQTVELHGLTLCEQFAHTIDYLTQYQHTHLIVGDLAVTSHVAGELQPFRASRLRTAFLSSESLCKFTNYF